MAPAYPVACDTRQFSLWADPAMCKPFAMSPREGILAQTASEVHLDEEEVAGEELAELIAQACIEEEEPTIVSPGCWEAAPVQAPVFCPPGASHLLQRTDSAGSSQRTLSRYPSSGECSLLGSPTSVLRRNGNDAWDLLATAAGRIQGCDSASSMSSPSTSASGSPRSSPPRNLPCKMEVGGKQRPTWGPGSRKNISDRKQRPKDFQQERYRPARLGDSAAPVSSICPLQGTGVFHPTAAPKPKPGAPASRSSAGSSSQAGNRGRGPEVRPTNQANVQKKAARPAPPVYIPERLVKALGLNVDSENNIVINRPPAVQGSVVRSCNQGKEVRPAPVMKLVRDDEVSNHQKRSHGGKGNRAKTTQARPVSVRGKSNLHKAEDIVLPSDWVY